MMNEKMLKDMMDIIYAVKASFHCLREVSKGDATMFEDRVARTCEEKFNEITKSGKDFSIAEVVVICFLMLLEAAKVANETMAEDEEAAKKVVNQFKDLLNKQ